MHELVVNFLREPGLATYETLRQEVIALEAFRPEHTAPEEVWELIEAERFDEAAAMARAQFPNHLLNPGLHIALGVVAEKKGDEKASDLEFYFAQKLREALLATGDGSLEHPYVVTRASEEYSIMSWLKITPRGYGMKLDKGRFLDVFETTDGGWIHFNAAIPLECYEV
ncbi:MAG: hypothetical protein KC910_02785 [Candidatus Eremiobacteraeota bacterium]|nr:hypothetical protein [Candidatus Eremiobacteraeota bacterium]